jgi:hypothetical protein
VHLLFYSTVDKAHFVAVIDERFNEVITIMPIEYSERRRIAFYTGNRLKALKQRAKDLVAQAPAVVEVPVTLSLPGHYIFVLYFRNTLSKTLRRKKVLIERDRFPGGKEQLEKDASIHVLLNLHASSDCLPYEHFEDVFFSVSKKGMPERFNLQQDKVS